MTNQTNRFARIKNLGNSASAESTQLARALDQANPVDGLSSEAFLQLLELTLESARVAHGSLSTKTNVQLAAGLEILKGGRRSQECFLNEVSTWTWGDLAGLSISPLIAFIYMRMVREVKAHQVTAEVDA